MMKKLVLAALVLVGFATLTADAAPSQIEVDAYAARMALYVSMGQNPDQITVSLGNYFGRSGMFIARHDGGTMTTDVLYQIGDGREITFLALVGTIKDKDAPFRA